ncbi:MAG: homocysteine S-methyltransferase family protein [Saprospiraceae bacterium]|nr:homocysteine S-methyltransferase family protein [Saprospiraceae bacterium]
MMTRHDLVNLMESRPHWLLDGAVGTELERRGFQTSLPFWTAFAAVESPQLLKDIHLDYLQAGADIITANTFRISRYLFEKADQLSDFLPTLHKTSELVTACQVDSRRPLIAASLAPLEDCYRPDLVPSRKTLQSYHRMQIEALCQFKFDFILAETINSGIEAEIICSACQEMDVALIVSLVTNGKGQLLSGERLDEVLQEITRYSPAAISLNCRSTTDLGNDAVILEQHYEGIKGIYANAPGSHQSAGIWKILPHANHILDDFTRRLLSMDIRIIGGCCGTNPTLIKAIGRVLGNSESS